MWGWGRMFARCGTHQATHGLPCVSAQKGEWGVTKSPAGASWAHKYIAHQVVLLHQSVSKCGKALEPFKAEIEMHFEDVKQGQSLSCDRWQPGGGWGPAHPRNGHTRSFF